MKSVRLDWKVVFEANTREPTVDTLDAFTTAAQKWAEEFAKEWGLKPTGGTCGARFSDRKQKP